MRIADYKSARDKLLIARSEMWLFNHRVPNWDSAMFVIMTAQIIRETEDTRPKPAFSSFLKQPSKWKGQILTEGNGKVWFVSSDYPVGTSKLIWQAHSHDDNPTLFQTRKTSWTSRLISRARTWLSS